MISPSDLVRHAPPHHLAIRLSLLCTELLGTLTPLDIAGPQIIMNVCTFPFEGYDTTLPNLQAVRFLYIHGLGLLPSE